MKRTLQSRQLPQRRRSLGWWLLLLALIGPGTMAETAMTTVAETTDTETVPIAAAENEEVLSVEDILTTPSEQAPGDSPRCLSTHRIRDVHVIDDQYVVFQINRSTYYLVEFKNRCPTMQPDATIVYEAMGQLCRLDSIRPIMGVGSFARVGPPCQIPGFQVISAEQLRLIKDQRKTARRRPELIETPDADEAAKAEDSPDDATQ